MILYHLIQLPYRERLLDEAINIVRLESHNKSESSSTAKAVIKRPSLQILFV
jgi:hypothetical protein